MRIAGAMKANKATEWVGEYRVMWRVTYAMARIAIP